MHYHDSPKGRLGLLTGSVAGLSGWANAQSAKSTRCYVRFEVVMRVMGKEEEARFFSVLFFWGITKTHFWLANYLHRL